MRHLFFELFALYMIHFILNIAHLFYIDRNRTKGVSDVTEERSLANDTKKLASDTEIREKR